MSRVFEITPKRIKRANGTVLTPEMKVTVTTLQLRFLSGAVEVCQAYMKIYGFDYKKANCNQGDFVFRALD